MAMRALKVAVPLWLPALALACGEPAAPPVPGYTVVKERAQDTPLPGSTADEKARFAAGDHLFDLPFREADGLGPLYIRGSCAGCHEAGARGPGTVQKFAAVEADGFTPQPVQPPYGPTERPYVTAGAHTPLVAAPDGGLKVTTRLGPPVFGRGYLEAIADAEIERVEAEQALRNDGISGRIQRVTFHSQENPGQPFHTHRAGDANLIGRFGLKARDATVDDFVADAFLGDMGLTSPMRPVEPGNPDGLTDDAKPGTDLELDTVNRVADYVRLVDIPTRAPAEGRGRELFSSASCAACHVPSLKTRADYPIAALAGIDAPVYTDLLLHDMGDALADGVAEESATSREWRTAPLIGMKLLRAYMHDGRARTIDEAIRAHAGNGSEANASAAAYAALSDADRAALAAFVESL